MADNYLRNVFRGKNANSCIYSLVLYTALCFHILSVIKYQHKTSEVRLMRITSRTICTRTVNVTDINATIVYRLTVEPAYRFVENIFTYSISVELKNSSGIQTDSTTCQDITSLFDEAMRIFNIVSKGAVTPITLNDVIYDLIG